MFSSLEIKGNAEVDLTIGVMDPAWRKRKRKRGVVATCNLSHVFFFGNQRKCRSGLDYWSDGPGLEKEKEMCGCNLQSQPCFLLWKSKEMQKWTWLLEWWTRLGEREREREREREVWLQLAISAMFSSLEIKGNAEADLTIGVMDPAGAGAGAGAVPRNRLDFSVGFAIYHSV
jgi:hypothetical protein